MENRNCIKCEEEFLPHQWNQKICVTCKEKHDKSYDSSHLSKPCKGCGEDFKKTFSRQAYCTIHCRNRNRHLIMKYGITRIDYDNMYEAQGRVCAICSGKGFNMRHNRYVLDVDHCHKTGKVRGLLCSNCNTGLGLFKDNTHTISKAISYLEGATTIEKSSTPKQVEAQSKGLKPLDDIV